MEKNFNPKKEKEIYEQWLEKKYFLPSEVGEPFSMILPPPNVTGVLHMGHTLINTIYDITSRYKRMKGFSVLLIPGLDHASIATEGKVVDKIKPKTKIELGREGFLKEAWKWKEDHESIILDQSKAIGLSADWSRYMFTLDPEPARVVEHIFIDFYKKGYIYRGERLVNWCTHCKTTISDAEVIHEENNSKIWHFKYKIKDSIKTIEIATTRPETILGDTAVAVNPDDERYKDLVGKTVIIPIVNREVVIIADGYVDKDFGTGAVKVTPAHDFNDNEMASRHNLKLINIMNDDGSINNIHEEFENLDRYEARKKIIKMLDGLGQFVEEKDIKNSLGCHDRCGSVVEPLSKLQWFVKMEHLAKPAIDVYKNNEIKFLPPRHGKTYAHWLENIKDWCISRQLWWGHRIPVFYCKCGHENIISSKHEKVCEKCAGKDLVQDEDVLDTWFSSAFWPFSTMGWPDGEDFKRFFPTKTLVTGYDILFFWVVRMIFSSISQTGKIPFDTVVFNGLIRDEQGRKFSKQLGNGVDPLVPIERYGADALRITLIMGNALGADQRFSLSKVEINRNFLNKIWNAARFVHLKIEENSKESDSYSKADLWILSRLNKTIEEATRNMENYEFGIALECLYSFIWEDYCDYYIEMSKIDLNIKVLKEVLISILKLMHPFAPFITEEIYQSFGFESLNIEKWPSTQTLDEPGFENIKTGIKAIRNLRAEMNVPPSKKIKLILITEDESHFSEFLPYFSLAGAKETLINKEFDISSVSIRINKAIIYLEDLFDKEKEIARLEKEIKDLEQEVKRAKNKLSNEGFISKAKPNLIEQEKEKLLKYEEALKKAEERLKVWH